MFVQPSSKILHIVPRIAPDVDGVGDYAMRLSRQLRTHHQIDSEFLVVRPSELTKPSLEGFTVRRFVQHTVPDFIEMVPADIAAVVLQYSNYPYLQGKLDSPMWLTPALKALQAKGIPVVVMFHELPMLRYGMMRVRNPIQERLSRDLAKFADGVVTNNEAFQKKLLRWRRGSVLCQPNFSTIGEPTQAVTSLSERDRTLIVFGSTERRRVYQSNMTLLKESCEHLGIHTLYDVGRPVEWDADSLGPAIKVIKTGILSNKEISMLMSQSFAGVFDYHRFPHNLGKSSVYAAYAAHGMLPVCNGRFLRPQDGIIADQHYVDTFTVHAGSKEAPFEPWLQVIATNAHRLYQAHSIKRSAQRYAELIQSKVQSALRSDDLTELAITDPANPITSEPSGVRQN
ncbi:MAG: hypothetical protein AAFR58_16855 [Cyanobacteria bacterium J06627_28]